MLSILSTRVQILVFVHAIHVVVYIYVLWKIYQQTFMVTILDCYVAGNRDIRVWFAHQFHFVVENVWYNSSW